MQKMVALTYKNKHFFLGEESILCCFLLFHFCGLQTQSMRSGLFTFIPGPSAALCYFKMNS